MLDFDTNSVQRIRRLALGTVQFGIPYGIANQIGQVALGDARAILIRAAEEGIDTIDTAIGYGDSERFLGEIGVSGFNVVTKLPALPVGHLGVAGWVNEQMANSLARLHSCRVYGVLLHKPTDLLGANGQALFNALCALKDRGLVERIGVSVYSPAELENLPANFRYDLVQAPLNLVDRRLFASGWLGRLKDRGVEVHTRSTFLQGLLLLPRNGIPAKFSRWADVWDRWHAWLSDHNEDAVRACLTYSLSLRDVDRVVVGTDSSGQFTQVLLGAALASKAALPDLACGSGDLINPARWPYL